jgi:hypothetical protein
MGKKASKQPAASRKRASLSDADAVFSRILIELRADPSHPQWPVVMRGVSALQELNAVMCLLISDIGGGKDNDFGPPGLSRR